MRPSKFRLPLSTETTERSLSLTAALISSGSGPELPMQVVRVGHLVGVLADHLGQRRPEPLLGLGKRYPVLRALRPRQRRDDVAQVELDGVRERRLLGGIVV